MRKVQYVNPNGTVVDTLAQAQNGAEIVMTEIPINKAPLSPKRAKMLKEKGFVTPIR